MSLFTACGQWGNQNQTSFGQGVLLTFQQVSGRPLLGLKTKALKTVMKHWPYRKLSWELSRSISQESWIYAGHHVQLRHNSQNRPSTSPGVSGSHDPRVRSGSLGMARSTGMDYQPRRGFKCGSPKLLNMEVNMIFTWFSHDFHVPGGFQVTQILV